MKRCYWIGFRPSGPSEEIGDEGHPALSALCTEIRLRSSRRVPRDDNLDWLLSSHSRLAPDGRGCPSPAGSSGGLGRPWHSLPTEDASGALFRACVEGHLVDPRRIPSAVRWAARSGHG